ncbi:FAD-binding protein [Streptomyces yaizuensis]|uniref:FAD-binding protein n=1 Tax=Streptomyces yaizuensis TaxID=2989713 RepID=A0ABQ5P864_9ACTN|nr:FAD-binding protein [Streptomyces sp. YSPA8]GLF98777.1 FAD-binding protein [Streptomyces sp. YSPA8]
MTGLRPATLEWTAAPGPGVVPVPELRGTLSTAAADLTGAARDFGNRLHHRPLAVLLPADAADIAAVVRFGRACGIPVVPRGAGHSVDGQAQARDGIVVDLTSLAAVGPPAGDRVAADAGARWSTVVDATLPHGLAPPVLPDHLGLSVGGTLAAGGFGGASHRYGSQADNVHALDVVTPTGDLVPCSPTRDADLFDAVRGSQGEYGIITRAALALTPAPALARVHRLVYRDLSTFLADQLLLIGEGRFDHVSGQALAGGPARPGPNRSGAEGWTFVLEAVAGFDPSSAPDDGALLDGLRYERGAGESGTVAYGDFLRRLAPIEAGQRATGSWQGHPHPRRTVLLPGRHAEGVIQATLRGLTARELGVGGSVLLYPFATARIAAPRVPRARDAVTVLFGLQRTAPPGEPAALEGMLRGNASLRSLAESLGGAGYSGPTAYHEARVRPRAVRPPG